MVTLPRASSRWPPKATSLACDFCSGIELSWWYFCVERTLHCAPVSILKHIFWWFMRRVTFQSGDLVVLHCTILIKRSSEVSEPSCVTL